MKKIKTERQRGEKEKKSEWVSEWVEETTEKMSKA